MRRKLTCGLLCITVLYGLSLHLNLSLLVFPAHFTGPTSGSFGCGMAKWWNLAAPCARWQKAVIFEAGIICTSLGVICGYFQRYQNAWYAKCFVPHELDVAERVVH